MTTLPFSVDRTLVIRATPDVVFSFFTDVPRWASWWGPGSTIDARPGGEVLIRYPNGVEVTGQVIEVSAPRRIVFSYGYASGSPIPPGGSRVTIQLDEVAEGTRLTLAHHVADAARRDAHTQGWRFQLSVFSNLVADVVHADASAVIDGWFEMYTNPDAQSREAWVRACAAPGVRFNDRYSAIVGIDELLPHIAAAQRFMPGVTLVRAGNVRRCRDAALCDWTATGPDGTPRGAGANVFEFDAKNRVAAVSGFWE